MSKYSKLNFVYRIQKWMDSVAGQTFLNYSYSWGASIVILGTLFKLTHLPLANFFLFLGMGTEVFVFFISAFDRPFDKTADGMALEHGMQQYGAREEMEIIPVDEEEKGVDALQRMIASMPDGEELQEVKKTLTAIHEVYKLHLTKAAGQMPEIEEIEKQLQLLAGNLKELNRMTARVVEAVKQ
jgi:hypothetical protein